MQAQINQHAASRWPLVRLGDVCEIIGGGTPSKEKPEFYNGDIRWATVRDMRNDVIEDTENKITAAAVKASATHIIPAGNVIIATRVGLGKTCLLAGDTAINQDLRGIVPAKTHTIVPKYLFYWFKSIAHKIIAEGTGATVQGVKVGFVQSLLLPLPPITEQQRIVARLDAAFAAIAEATAAAEANLRNARAVFDSYLDQVFSQRGPGWVERRLGDVCEITSNLVDPKLAENKFKLHVGAGNMVSSSNKLENVLTAEAEGLISGKYTFNIGMVLYSKIRPYLRKVSLPDFDGLCSADVYPLSPVNEAITPGFLFYLLLSNSFTDYAIQGSGRAGMPKVNREHLFEYMTLIPSITAQNEITRVLFQLSENTELLGCIFESKSLALTELKKSLLAEVFGEG